MPWHPGSSRILQNGPITTKSAESSCPIAPIHIVGTTPSQVPSGAGEQRRDRHDAPDAEAHEAFMRPSRRGGVMRWRKVTCVML